MRIIIGKIGLDKVYHLYAGLSFALLTAFIELAILCLGAPITPVNRLVWPVVMAFTAGVAKELYDVIVENEYFDILDVVFTTAGTLPVTAIMYETVILF